MDTLQGDLIAPTSPRPRTLTPLGRHQILFARPRGRDDFFDAGSPLLEAVEVRVGRSFHADHLRSTVHLDADRVARARAVSWVFIVVIDVGVLVSSGGAGEGAAAEAELD